MIYPTRRAVILMAAGVPLSLLCVVIYPSLWMIGAAWVALVLAACAYDALQGPRLAQLDARLHAPKILYIGEVDPLRLTVSTSEHAMRLSVDVHVDGNKVLTPLPSARIRVIGGQADAIFELRPLMRGMAEIQKIWLRWEGPWGLMARRKIVSPQIEIAVVPNVRGVRAAAIAFFARDARLGQKWQRDKGEGREFAALKEHVAGLDIRAVDWKHSARHKKLLVKEFESERNHNIIFAIDCGHLMREPLAGVPRLDRAINAALIAGYVSAKQGDKVGLFAFNDKARLHLSPASGDTGFRRLERASADIVYSVSETNFTLGLSKLAARLNRRSLIILMTEFVDTTTAELMLEAVGRLTKRHFVLFTTFRDPALEEFTQQRPHGFTAVTKSVVAADFMKERSLVLTRLRHKGADILDTSHDAFSTDLVNRYLHIKERGLV